MGKSLTILSMAALLVASQALAQDTKPAAALPGGASNLTETFEDWQVICTAAASKPNCVIRQTQAQQNGQRVLEVALAPAKDKGAVMGALSLPFGLALARGVTLQVDDAAPGEPLAFSTCMPSGCIVPLELDTATVATLNKGTSLKLAATSIENKAVQFPVSLKGFAAALERATGLTN